MPSQSNKAARSAVDGMIQSRLHTSVHAMTAGARLAAYRMALRCAAHGMSDPATRYGVVLVCTDAPQRVLTP